PSAYALRPRWLPRVKRGLKWVKDRSAILTGGHAMITKFDSLFAGHVDIENAGYGGTAVNDRRYSNEHLATVFDKAEAMAKLMDRIRHHTLWWCASYF